MKRVLALPALLLLAACATTAAPPPAADPAVVSRYVGALEDAAETRERFLRLARAAYDAGLLDDAGRERARQIGRLTRLAGNAAKAVLDDYSRTGDSVILAHLSAYFVTDRDGERTRLRELVELLEVAAELGLDLAEVPR